MLGSRVGSTLKDIFEDFKNFLLIGVHRIQQKE